MLSYLSYKSKQKDELHATMIPASLDPTSYLFVDEEIVDQRITGFLWRPQSPTASSYPFVLRNTLECDLAFVHVAGHTAVLEDKLCYSKSELKFGNSSLLFFPSKKVIQFPTSKHVQTYSSRHTCRLQCT